MKAVQFLFALFGLAIVLQATPGVAQSGNQIEISKNLLGSHKYSLGNDDRQPVYKSFGGYQDHFLDVLSDVPAALEEAERAKTGQSIELVGHLTVFGGLAYLLADAIRGGTEGASSGDLSPDVNFTPVYVLVGFGISGIGAVIKGRHLKESVRIYNEHQNRVAKHSRTPGLQLSVQPKLVSNRPGLSIRLR